MHSPFVALQTGGCSGKTTEQSWPECAALLMTVGLRSSAAAALWSATPRPSLDQPSSGYHRSFSHTIVCSSGASTSSNSEG